MLCAALGAAALGARLSFFVAFEESPLFSPVAGGHDRALYHQAAQGPLRPEGAYAYMPLYPIALRGAYALFGADLRVAAALGIACDTLTCMLIAMCALSLGAKLRIAAIAGLLYALYPLAIVYSALTMPVSLNALMTVLFCFLALRAPRERAVSSFALGLVAGIATLGWAAWLAMAAAWIAFDIARGPNRVKRAAYGLLFALAFALPIAPVAWHNTRAEGRFVLLTTHGGFNFYIGNHERATGHPVRVRDFRMTATAMLEDAHRAAEAETGRTLTRAESSAWWREQAHVFWRSKPKAAMKLTARKALLFWHRVDVDDLRMVEQSRLLLGRFDAPWWPGFAAIGWLGLVGLLRAPQAGALKALTLAGMASLVAYFITARYRLALAPLLLALGAAGATRLLDDLRARRFWLVGLTVVAAALPVGWPLAIRDLRATDYYNMAIQLLHANRPADALRMADAGLRTAPRDAALYHAHGEALFRLEAFSEAAEAFAACAALDPSHPNATYNYALSLARAGEICRARDALRAASARRPLPPNAEKLLIDLTALCESANPQTE
jgi:tetratricopeptide (TPR) repeat protein